MCDPACEEAVPALPGEEVVKGQDAIRRFYAELLAHLLAAARMCLAEQTLVRVAVLSSARKLQLAPAVTGLGD